MKRIIVSGAISLVLNLFGMLVNYLSYRSSGWLLLKTEGWGGEITIEYGYGGLRVVHIFAMMEGESGSVNLTFDPVLFLISLLGTWVAVWLILTAVSFFRKRRA